MKACWPSGWGNIRIGTLPLHYKSPSPIIGALSGSEASIILGPATLHVDLAKPSVSASW